MEEMQIRKFFVRCLATLLYTTIAVLIPARPFRNLKTRQTHHHNSGLWYVIDKDL